MLDRHQHRAAPLAADAKPLRDSQHDQQYRRPDPDLVIRGKTADQESGNAHDQQGENQHRLAADLIAEVTADYSSNGPRREPDGVGTERSERAGQRVVVWEKELVEDERAGGAVEKKVIPLDGRADEAGDGDSSNRRIAGGCDFQTKRSCIVRINLVKPRRCSSRFRVWRLSSTSPP